jgi:hypothetical protein
MTPENHGHSAATPRIASAFLAKLEDRYDVAEVILFGSTSSIWRRRSTARAAWWRFCAARATR